MGGVASNFEIQKMKSASRSDRSKMRSKEHLVFKKRGLMEALCYNYVAKLNLPFKTHTHTQNLINQEMHLAGSNLKCLN